MKTRAGILCALLAVGWTTACDTPPVAGTDAATSDASVPTDAGGDPAAAEAPRIPWLAAGEPAIAPPATPVFGTCPPGWRSVVIEGVSACDPWPAAGAPSCDDLSAVTPGGACAVVGSACPADGWPATLPPSGVRYVQAGATGGDGSRTTPFGTIAAALVGITSGTTIALAAGEHVGTIALPSGVTLVGACASGTTLRSDVADVDVGVIDVIGTDVVVRDVSITGPRPGVSLSGSGRGVVVEDAILHDLVRYGLRIVGTHVVRVRRSLIRDVIAPAATGRGGRGAQIESGADVELESLEVRDVRSAGIASFDTGTAVVVRDAWVHEVLPDPTLANAGSAFATGLSASLTGERLAVARVHQTGVLASDSGTTVVLSDVNVADVDAGAAGEANGQGLGASGSASVVATRAVIVRATAGGVAAETMGHLELSDSLVLDVRMTSTNTEGRSVVARSGSTVELSRVRLVGSHEFSVIAVGGSTLTGADVSIERGEASGRAYGLGVRCDASTVALDRVDIRDVYAVGVSVYGAGGTLSMSDARIADVTPVVTDGIPASIGAFVEEDAAATLTRISILAVTEPLAVRTRGSAVVEDSVLDTTDAPLAPSYGIGSLVSRGASLTLRRARVVETFYVGLGVSGVGTHLGLEDVSFEGIRVEGTLPAYGVVASLGGEAELARVRVESSSGGALIAGTGASVHAADLSMAEIGTAAGIIRFAVVATGADTSVVIERVAIDGAQGFGLAATDDGSLIASDVVVQQTLESTCTTCEGMAGTGVTIVRGAHLELHRFLIDGAALAGVYLGDDDFIVDGGLITRATIGVALQTEGVDPARFATIRLVDNVVDLDARELPVPEPSLPPLTEGL